MINIGLLMCRNEGDVIKEALDEHAKYFDYIVAMDGSTDDSREIIKMHPHIGKIFYDEAILKPGERWNDGCRQVALDWIREHWGLNTWITLLHADEFWEDNPIEVARKANEAGATYVLWGEYRFFLHTRQLHTFDTSLPLKERVTWYAGPWFETRQFNLMAHNKLKAGEDHKVLPEGERPPLRFAPVPRYRHYPYRSPAQTTSCWYDKVKLRYWQPDHAWIGERRGDYRAYFRDGFPEPKNSPLAQWNKVGNIHTEPLPDALQFLPQWWRDKTPEVGEVK
jgi:hypothetical protein